MEVTILDYIEALLYPVYFILSSIVSFMVLFNQKRIKKRFKIDMMVSFMIIYITNFFICYFNFNLIHIYVRVALPLIVIFISIYISNKITIIGLTGGIACGKSAVGNHFQDILKLSIIDCDLLARRVVEVGKPAYNKLKAKYGSQILQQDGQIDRKELGKLVFNNASIRQFVTRVTGIYILLEIVKEVYHIAFVKKEDVMMLDAPILFESKYLEYFCYPILVVFVSQEEIQIQRLMKRDNITQEEALKKIQSQMPLSKKIEKADITLCNDGTTDELYQQITRKIPDLIL